VYCKRHAFPESLKQNNKSPTLVTWTKRLFLGAWLNLRDKNDLFSELAKRLQTVSLQISSEHRHRARLTLVGFLKFSRGRGQERGAAQNKTSLSFYSRSLIFTFAIKT